MEKQLRMPMQCKFIPNHCVVLHNTLSAQLTNKCRSHCNAHWTEPSHMYSTSW